MHVLPFVSIFLIILTSLSYSFLDKSKTLIYEKQMALSYMKVERQLLRTLHREAFKKIPKKKKSSEPSQKPAPNPEYSPRLHSHSKMNLFPLLTEKTPSECQQVFKRLLKALYQNSPFLDRSTIDVTLSHLSETIIKTGKNHLALCKSLKEDLSSIRLSDLYPETTSEHALFYKMLKGTHRYDLAKEGYPPLEDFFCLEEHPEPYIAHFPSLSPLMLTVIFGTEEGLAILEEEQDLRTKTPERVLKTLSKEELVAFLNKQFPSKTSLSLVIEHLDFSSHSTKKEPLIVYDKLTHLQIEKTRV